jgi:hypothetical protein
MTNSKTRSYQQTEHILYRVIRTAALLWKYKGMVIGPAVFLVGIEKNKSNAAKWRIFYFFLIALFMIYPIYSLQNVYGIEPFPRYSFTDGFPQ